MSALPPKADITSRKRHVCFVPKADIRADIRSVSVRRRRLPGFAPLLGPSIGIIDLSALVGIELIRAKELHTPADRFQRVSVVWRNPSMERKKATDFPQELL